MAVLDHLWGIVLRFSVTLSLDVCIEVRYKVTILFHNKDF